MAVDTRNKRASCVSVSLQNLGHGWPHPDGSLAAQADRQHSAFAYPGILAGAGSGVRLSRLTLLGAGCWWGWLLLRGGGG